MNGANAAEQNKQYVLVVDSNVNDRLSTCMLLLRFGRNIFTANTTEEAIEFMSMAPPVAVVAEADPAGLTLLPRMQNDLRFLHVPLILLSASPNADLEIRTRQREFDAYLTKPLNAEEFYRIVQSIIEKGPRRKIRIATRVMAALEDGSRRSEGYVTSLSEDGMFFRTLELRPKNALIPVSFTIRGRAITLIAEVLYTTTFEEGPFKDPGMGMKFVKVSSEDRDVIRTFILERVREGTAQQGAEK